MATKLTNIFAKCSDEEADSSIFTTLLASRIFSLYGKSITMSAKDTHFSKEELEQGIIRRMNLNPPLPKRCIGYAYLKNSPLSHATKAFMDLISQ